MRIGYVILMTASCSCAAQASRPETKPGATEQMRVDKPEVEEHAEAVENIFGEKIRDPFQWLESTGPAISAWMTGRDAATRTMLDRRPELAEFRKRIRASMDATDDIEDLHVAGGRAFYLRRRNGESMARLCVRPSPGGGAERVLFELTGNEPAAISQVTPSWDGHIVAFAVQTAGTEDNTVHFMDSDSGRELSDRMNHIVYADISWIPGHAEFYYRRYPNQMNAEVGKRRLDSEIWLHAVGRSNSEDKLVLARTQKSLPDLQPDDILSMQTYPGSEYELACVYHGASKDVTIFARRFARRSEKSHGDWKKVIDRDDAVSRFSVAGGVFYAISRRTNPLGQLVAIGLNASSSVRRILDAEDRTLVDVEAYGNEIYLLDENVTGGRIRHVDSVSRVTKTVSLPFDATVNYFNVDRSSGKLFIQIEGWTDSPRWLSISPKDLSSDDPFPDEQRVSSPGLKLEHRLARSRDGTLVPLTVLWRESARGTGPRPLLMQAYGAYEARLRPAFTIAGSTWLDNGGILAYAHVRGGGELGREWHLAGIREKKQNSVDDLIACSQSLIDDGLTTASELGLAGSSAGGLVAGMAVVERPELFGALYIRSGLVNVSRLSKTEIGPSNAKEFGSPDTKEGFDSLLSMDVYQQVKDGVAYPSALIVVGLNDRRVPAWQGAKLAARLESASTSGRPVFLSVDAMRGHAGTTADQEVDLNADLYTFMTWQLGASMSSRTAGLSSGQ